MSRTPPAADRPLSLLWPMSFAGRHERKPIEPRLEEDLDLTIFLLTLSGQDHRRERWLRQVALDLQTDPELIRYRQEAFDLLDAAPDSPARQSLKDLLVFVTERKK